MDATVWVAMLLLGVILSAKTFRREQVWLDGPDRSTARASGPLAR